MRIVIDIEADALVNPKKLKVVNCALCNIEFLNNSNNKVFCSKDCRLKFYKTYGHMKWIKDYQKDYHIKNKEKRNKRQRDLHLKKYPIVNKTCELCGKDFTACRRNTQRFCSRMCNSKWHYPIWFKRNYITRLLIRIKHRSKKLGFVPSDLTREYLESIIPVKCPILGIELIRCSLGSKGPRENSLTLDRIDNDKGYVKGNVAFISNRANLWKSSATIEGLEKLLNYMKFHKCES